MTEVHGQSTDRLDRVISGLLCGYAAVCTISVPGANVFIDIALFLAAIRLWLSRSGLRMDRRLCILVAAMVGTGILAGVFAEVSRKSIQPVWFILYHTAPLFLAILFVRSARQATVMILCLAASLTVTSVYALAQSAQGVVRPPGFTGDWFILAGQLGVLVPFFYVLKDGDPALPARGRQALFVLLGLSAGAMAVNGTRGVWIAVGVSLLVYMACAIRSRQYLARTLIILAIAAILVTGIVAVAQNNAAVRFMSRGSQTAVERMVIWKSSLNMIQDHPFFGIGPGNFAEQYQYHYFLPEARERKSQPHSHNNLLAVSSEMGIVGLAAYLALFFYILRHFWTGARTEKDNIRLWAVLLASLSFQLHGMSDYTFLGFPTVIQTYWFLVGLIWNHPHY